MTNFNTEGNRMSFDLGGNLRHTSVRQQVLQFEKRNSRAASSFHNPPPTTARASTRRSQKNFMNKNDFEALRMTEIKAQELTIDEIDNAFPHVHSSDNLVAPKSFSSDHLVAPKSFSSDHAVALKSNNSESSGSRTTSSSVTLSVLAKQYAVPKNQRTLTRIESLCNVREEPADIPQISIEFKEVDFSAPRPTVLTNNERETYSPQTPPNVPQRPYYLQSEDLTPKSYSFVSDPTNPSSYYQPNSNQLKHHYQEKDYTLTSKPESKLTVTTEETDTSLSSISSLGEEGPEDIVVKQQERKKSIRWADNLENFEEVDLNDAPMKKIEKHESLSPRGDKSPKDKKRRSFWSIFSCTSSDTIDQVEDRYENRENDFDLE